MARILRCVPCPTEESTTKSEGNPFTPEVLGNPLPKHFKPVNYEYDVTTDIEDHVAKFENVALLHQYSEEVKCKFFPQPRWVQLSSGSSSYHLDP